MRECCHADFPRDQELRYTVHDSPDYYQLKVSVFNDDKKTDLIGETWVDLKEVVVPGGGQNDLWHNLSCKGKYAGEIRIEITYYDTRPKQEKPERNRPAAATANGVDEGSRDSLRGPRQPKSQSPIKRRPLPSDPVTGAPALPVNIPDQVQTPPRGYPSSSSSSVPPEHASTPPRGYQNAPGSVPEHRQTPPRGHPNHPSAIPDHVQTPQRGYQSPNFIPNQSPLQNMEYSAPPSNFSPAQRYDEYGLPSGASAGTPPAQSKQNYRHDVYEPVQKGEYSHSNFGDSYRGDDESVDLRDRHMYQQPLDPYDLPQPDSYGTPPSPGGPPPPPPAHRSRAETGSHHASPHLGETRESYGYSPNNRSPNPYETAAHEPHRHSVSSHSPHSGAYRAYSPEKNQESFRRSTNGGHQQSPPRHHSYDSRYDADYGSMQPTVEDAPPSPGAGHSRTRMSSRVSRSDERRYDQVASTAPLNTGGRGSAASGRHSTSNAYTQPGHHHSHNSMGYSASSRTAYNYSTQQDYMRNEDQMGVDANHQRPRGQSYDQQIVASSNYQRPRGQSGNQMNNYALPSVPATLVPGMDPMIAQEISERIYDEKRAVAGNATQGRYQSSPQNQYSKPKLLSYHENDASFVPAPSASDERQPCYSAAQAPATMPRGVSPDPRVPIRKSVSPSPHPFDDQVRMSGIPFGPDSYNALNTSLVGSASTPSLSTAYDTKNTDAEAKIITHDGREIDPSDHIPESNYAPLLESKGPKYASQLPDRNYRPPPTGSASVSATGRRQLKVVARPHSMSASPSYANNTQSYDPITPTGRNRLQKKSDRMSAYTAQGSSPLAPISSYQDKSYSERSFPRSHSTDYQSNENYASSYGGSPGHRGSAGPPPIPGKIPMNDLHESPQPSGRDAWALLEEMKNIDLGSGRARRRGY